MPRISLLPTVAREIFLREHQPRVPEPMVMDEPDQVAAFAEAGRIDGIMSASYLFQSARISQTLSKCKHVLDLGCGPATQLAQIAQLNPNITFTGLDLSEDMLESGREYISANHIDNVRLQTGDITNLEDFSDQSVDGIISTMVLHQLPELHLLESTFNEITRILKPEGALYLVDFGRLKSPKSCHFFSHLNADHQPTVFTDDYQASLHAAFLFKEYQQLTKDILPSHISVFGSFPIPMLTIVKSPDQQLSNQTRQQLFNMRQNLPQHYRKELDDIRFFMWLGGMKNDPFKKF